MRPVTEEAELCKPAGPQFRCARYLAGGGGARRTSPGLEPWMNLYTVG